MAIEIRRKRGAEEGAGTTAALDKPRRRLRTVLQDPTFWTPPSMQTADRPSDEVRGGVETRCVESTRNPTTITKDEIRVKQSIAAESAVTLLGLATTAITAGVNAPVSILAGMITVYSAVRSLTR